MFLCCLYLSTLTMEFKSLIKEVQLMEFVGVTLLVLRFIFQNLNFKLTGGLAKLMKHQNF